MQLRGAPSTEVSPFGEGAVRVFAPEEHNAIGSLSMSLHATFAQFPLMLGSTIRRYSPKNPKVGALLVPALLHIVTPSISGCASSTPPAAQLSMAQQVAPLAMWWRRFNDPLLTSLVVQALQANASILAATAALHQVRAVRDTKSAALWPTLLATSAAQRTQSDFNAPGNTFTAGVNFDWQPDIFGAQHKTLEATDADALAAQASLGAVQVAIAADVALNYIQLRGLQAQLAIARSNFDSQNETLQITTWRSESGLATSLEVEQARTATEQTGSQIPAFESSIARTAHILAVLTGQTPQSLQSLLTSERPVPQANEALAQTIPAQTLRQRADVRAAEHRIRAALARISAAEAARYPSFSINGSLGLSALTLAGLANGAVVGKTLLGSVSVPLFDGGSGQAQVLVQETALEQARANYQATVLTALQEVEDALVALDRDRERFVRLQSAAQAAGNAALLAQNRYAAGLIDFQTVLQTQRSLLSTQDSVAIGQSNISADHVLLYKALGGGWSNSSTDVP
jgi:NodT family efflux transporter outer membrane factor (OMF) lipoprotein